MIVVEDMPEDDHLGRFKNDQTERSLIDAANIWNLIHMSLRKSVWRIYKRCCRINHRVTVSVNI
jgi:hypothetical protein